MSAWPVKTVLFLGLCALGLTRATAHELSGYVAAETRLFFNSPAFDKQENHSGSVLAQPEYYHEWESGSSFTFTPFMRVDSADPERTHFDLRELNCLWLEDTWELRVGIGKVFWGTTEFVHLVDIINQTDLVESINEEDKLGQPMVHLSVPRDWGTLDMFVLPYFRERTFPGRRGRLRTGLVVDTDNPRFTSAAEEYHVDFAMRYSHTIGDWDFGLSYFNGTGREPVLLTGLDGNGNPVLIPSYEQIEQVGSDIQRVAGNWLWKLETLHRTGQTSSFFAAVGGFEYSFYGIADTDMDLGLVGEYAYDDRGDQATSAFQNDVMMGLRLALNDPSSTELLAGLMQDTQNSGKAVSLEASRRIGSNWKLSLEAWAFLNQSQNDPLYSLRDDDFVQLELAYHF